ncbi:ribonuclease H-like domain-containing protein [Crucibulum laeve]|uniref:Ribonuclease H-like domain-containing protein n=1 Tax=Crucibulum laeve TaxID=68775 RepID=A0A5C3MDQ1_9AGAR|nr:ribonuclease H-like domain-containing protein [Crucibulum laeve]
MFSSLRLFQNVSCPEKQNCKRPHCIFSHRTDLPPPPPLNIPIEQPKPAPADPPKRSPVKPSNGVVVPAKRPISTTLSRGPLSAGPSSEPPRKLQKVGSSTKPIAVPSASHTNTGVPIIRVNTAQSLVAIPVRQTMLKTLYDHFLVLYNTVLPLNPTLASEHALKQEAEVYKKSSKLTYRNAVIQCVAAIKRRPVPTSLSHPSVGTEEEIVARAEAKKSLESLRLTSDILEPLILSVTDLVKWGYFVEIPEGPGGYEPSLEGKVTKCERCGQPFQVKRMEQADECIYHWGKSYSTTAEGKKIRVYRCCSRPVTDEGCSHGPHVFYESKAEELHVRHAFSFLQPANQSSSALDVAAMDCEMVYTTGGMRVARVSVVDGAGVEIFDELVKMDEGVHVIDYVTRFSGITEEGHSKALLPLVSIRKALDLLIDQDTILIGHGLDNDLKTLRIIHHKCIDTAILFPHSAGAPYRRALKDLVREKLGRLIQTGDATVGHSSAEDATATLDLVRWHILETRKTGIQPKKS